MGVLLCYCVLAHMTTINCGNTLSATRTIVVIVPAAAVVVFCNQRPGGGGSQWKASASSLTMAVG